MTAVASGVALLLSGAMFLVVRAATTLTITPSVSPTPNEAGWNNADVTVDWTVDPGDGFVLGTPAPSGCDEAVISGETASNVLTCSATTNEVVDDVPVSDSVDVTVKLDKTAPVVTVTTPADGVAIRANQVKNASWSATDALSLIDSSSGTVESGSPFPVPTAGPLAFTVDATDVAGNTTEVINTYYVVDNYTFGGITTPTRLSKRTLTGKTSFPVKFVISDGSGHYAPYATARLYVDGNPAVSNGSNSTNYFRYDGTGGSYTYNLSVKKYGATVGSHTLRIDLDDGNSYTRSFSVTK